MNRLEPVLLAVKHLHALGVDVKPYLIRIGDILKTEVMFLRQLKQYCRELFRGDLSQSAFLDDMMETIADQLHKAWREGAREVGVSGEEADADPMIFTIINGEYNQVDGLAIAIIEFAREGHTFEEYAARFNSRIELWARRYADVVNRAKAHFGRKIKLEWMLGATEEHCETCNRLNGLVAYAEEWQTARIFPQNPPNSMLECGGWRCGCTLEITDKRRSPDVLGTLLDIATAANL